MLPFGPNHGGQLVQPQATIQPRMFRIETVAQRRYLSAFGGSADMERFEFGAYGISSTGNSLNSAIWWETPPSQYS